MIREVKPFPFPPGAGSGPTGQPFPWELQQYSNWCWVVCARLVALQFGRPAPPQCGVAQQVLQVAGCCDAATADLGSEDDSIPRECNQLFLDAAIPEMYMAHFNIPAFLAPDLSEGSLQKAFQTGKPAQCLFKWDSGGGHYVLVFGAVQSNGASFYRVSDPLFGRMLAAFDHIATAYGKGELYRLWAT